MNRRAFNKTSGIIGTASLLPFEKFKLMSSKKYKLGYQLYSVNDDMHKDTLGTLKALIQMGYEDFEIYEFDPQKITFYGIDAKELKSKMDDLGISATSGHYGFTAFMLTPLDELKEYTDQVIKGAFALNTPYIVWPYLHPALRNYDGFKLLVEKLNFVGERVTKAGLQFAYHNNGYEWQGIPGERLYDLVLSQTDPEYVKLQMDMYWVMHEGQTTPKELVKEHSGRFTMWHIKDMDPITRDYTELGNGAINYHNVLPDPEASGLEYYYIEQGGNFTKSAIESAQFSADYFKKNLKSYI